MTDKEWGAKFLNAIEGTPGCISAGDAIREDRTQSRDLLRRLADGLVEINGRPVIYVGIQELRDLQAHLGEEG